MTSLDAMTITGVRSVSPEGIQGIKFFKPLTLIVGENGAGKTTIIECLKYVCTGSFPPASGKGAAFVHDPKLRGANEVTAQVRLRLHSANGVTFWATRTSKVKSMGSGKKSFQSVESKLDMKIAETTRKAVATTCAAVTSGIADLMGVSTAVLEYVIFCHQEESNWPLGEPKELKTRFDEIFAVSRYTKAMDEIKKARKRFTAEIKVLEEQLKLQNVRREQAGVLIAEIKTKEEARLALTSDIEKVQFSINKLTAERKHARDMIKHLKTTFDELQRLATLEQQAQLSINQFGASQNEFSELSLEELLERRDNLHLQMQQDKAQQETLAQQIHDLGLEIQKIEQQRLSLTHKHASVHEHIKRLPALSAERTELAQGFLKGYPPVFKDSPFSSGHLSSSSSALPSPSIAQILALANDYVPKIQAHVTNLTTKNADEVKTLDERVQQTTTHLAQLQGSEEALRARLSVKEQEALHVSEELDKAKVAIGAGAESADATKYSEALLALQRLEADPAFSHLAVDIRRVEKQLSMLEYHAEVLRQWTRYSNGILAFETRLEHYMDRQVSLDTKFNTQLPLLNESLMLFKPYGPAAGDHLTDFLPSFGNSATFSAATLRDSPTIVLLLDSTNNRIKTFKQQMTKTEEDLFDLSTQHSSLSIAIEQLTTELSKASKSLTTKKDVFLRKFRQIPHIEASSVDNIEVFFQTDLGKAELVNDDDEDDLVVLSGAEVRSNGVPSSQPGSLPINSSQPSTAAQLTIEESLLFTSLLSATKDEVQRTETRCAVLRASKDMYDSLLQHVAEKSECPICGTGVTAAHDHRRVNDRVSSLMDLIPSQLAEAEEHLAAQLNHLEALEKVSPLWNDICEKYSVFPKQQKQLSRKQAEKTRVFERLTEARIQAENGASLLKQMMSVQSMLHSLLKDIEESETVRSLMDEQLLLQSAVERPDTPAPPAVHDEEFELDPSVVGFLDYSTLSSLKAREIDSLATQAAELLKTTKQRLASLRTDLETYQAEKKDYETIVSKYQANFVATSQLNATITVSEQKLAEVESELESLHKEIEKSGPTLKEANEQYLAAKAERDRVMQEHKARTEKYREQSETFAACLAKLDAAHKAVVAIESQLGVADVSHYESEMETLKETAERLKQELRSTEQSLAMLKAHDESSRRRALQEALKYREIVRQRQEYESKIAEHQAITEGQTPEQLEAKIESLDRKIEKEMHLRSSNQGKCESLAKDIISKKTELKTQSKSGDVEAEWTKVFVQLETTKMASNDLAISHDVLDKTLMRYHSSKMSDINQILKELWESTYQGNDIDYVKIVAENDESTSAGSKVQKNFNYRVVMVKGGVELDMRGRCSAGQKVLASLMIRMALAETFCLNCGILALDEPTSNLDQANVESLAESLRRVIEVRQKQSNFQIIIITHDEEFVKVIGRNSWTDEYYKVKKTPEHYSIIAKKSMRELK